MMESLIWYLGMGVTCYLVDQISVTLANLLPAPEELKIETPFWKYVLKWPYEFFVR